MAATYSYGGDFSSDDDYERNEQAGQAKWKQFEAHPRPSQDQIDNAIEQIKNLGPDEDFQIADDLLGAILDLYKTQRGPIVESTRKLYQKFVLRAVRGDSDNGNPANDNNNNDDSKTGDSPGWPTKNILSHDVPSSDDDEPNPPFSSQSNVEFQRSKLDKFILDTQDDEAEPMDVDLDVSNGAIRDHKQVDISSSEESEEEEDSTGSDTETTSESGLDVTETAPKQVQAVSTKQSVSAPKPLMASTPINKTSQMRKLTTYNDKDAASTRKPYTRSQKAVHDASANASNSKISLDISSKASQSRTSKFRVKYFIVVAIIIAVVAFFLFLLRSHQLENVKKAGKSLLSIKF